MRLTVPLLNNAGPDAAYTPLLERLVRDFCNKNNRDDGRARALVKTAPLLGGIDRDDDVRAIVLSGSAIVPLSDIVERGEATSWNVSVMAAFPAAPWSTARTGSGSGTSR